ncbi:MAG: hypothetical protein H6923_03455 [Alphaproteobacteria bacterium]|nr:hypothetical protein [Alphaproteobacteria bacterium]
MRALAMVGVGLGALGLAACDDAGPPAAEAPPPSVAASAEAAPPAPGDATVFRPGIDPLPAPPSLSVEVAPMPSGIPGLDTVVVNGAYVAPERAGALGVPGGRYWYDAASGLWGHEGQPTEGQIAAGLDLGGTLAAGASGAGTSAPHTEVFFNGRELHPVEVQLLFELFGEAPRGRYWLDAALVGGREGGPPSFDLGRALAEARAKAGKESAPPLPPYDPVEGKDCDTVALPNGTVVSTC